MGGSEKKVRGVGGVGIWRNFGHFGPGHGVWTGWLGSRWYVLENPVSVGVQSGRTARRERVWSAVVAVTCNVWRSSRVVEVGGSEKKVSGVGGVGIWRKFGHLGPGHGVGRGGLGSGGYVLEYTSSLGVQTGE